LAATNFPGVPSWFLHWLNSSAAWGGRSPRIKPTKAHRSPQSRGLGDAKGDSGGKRLPTGCQPLLDTQPRKSPGPMIFGGGGTYVLSNQIPSAPRPGGRGASLVANLERGDRIPPTQRFSFLSMFSLGDGEGAEPSLCVNGPSSCFPLPTYRIAATQKDRH